MEKYYINTNQISDSYDDYKHTYPKYDKSTTDPTYYEPSATRIANMRKASGVQMSGIYDFYSKDDVSKFNENNFKNNIQDALVDPRFNTKLLREEISQVSNTFSNSVDKMLDKKSEEKNKRKERINEAIEVSKSLNDSSTNSNNSETE